ncbi:uridine phosphorylase [Pyrodictium occultum]|uniref:Uridine phosphorylase n=1 Tax=Pyrodictium occultum TaxID=2309 RepID=A0A0V8RUW3_PYROC|nr:uridine phosphorylase [Pyrodictium occultum]KSW11825.1 uridine phosphorylase [Pyrodictium occultum]
MERISASAPVVNNKMYHISLGPGDIPPYILLPGDPGRIDAIMRTWDEAEEVAFHREYRSARGVYRGARIGALSTGIGGASTAIAVEELARIGVHTLIRVGTMGAIQPDIKVGDLVIGFGAVRYECASSEYAPPEYPAAASPEVVMALVEAAERLGARYHLGIVASTATFHLGQSRPGYRDYTWSGSRARMENLRRMGVLGFEMEAATIFTLSNIYRLRSGCVCAVIANRVTDEFIPEAGVREAIMVANEAVRILQEADKSRPTLRHTLSSLAVALEKLYGKLPGSTPPRGP